MSRSVKKYSCHYMLCGAQPSLGKKITSRQLRRKIKQLIHKDFTDFDFFHIQDRNRGRKGSKSRDYGWDFFGDGFIISFNTKEEEGEYSSFLNKSKRK